MLTPDVLLEAEDAEEEILEDVEELGSYSPQSVSIERPSSEASSISPLEAEEETLEVVAVVGGDLGMFFTADRLDCQSAYQDRSLNKLGPYNIIPFCLLANVSPTPGLDK